MSELPDSPCPFHAQMPATDICQRCGGFTCLQCQQHHPRFCSTCAGHQAPFLFNRGNLNVVDLLFAAWNQVFKKHGAELSVAAFFATLAPGVLLYGAFVLPALLGATLSGPGILPALRAGNTAALGLGMFFGVLVFVFLALVVVTLVATCFQCGLAEMTHVAWNGQRPAFGALFNFKVGLKAALAGFLLSFVAMVLWVLVSVLAAAFGSAGDFLRLGALMALYAWILPASLLFHAFAENPRLSAVEAIFLCMKRGQGFRLKIFLVQLLSLPLLLLGVLAFGFGLFPAMALVFAHQAGLWKALAEQASPQ